MCDRAIEIWDRVSLSFSSTITAKLDVLGAPPRLYRGDLCLVLPAEKEVDASCPDARYLGVYVDATHASFFDSAGEPLLVRAIYPATAAAKEDAILRYTKAVAQCKKLARKSSSEIVKRCAGIDISPPQKKC